MIKKYLMNNNENGEKFLIKKKISDDFIKKKWKFLIYNKKNEKNLN
jgi:hypothetical protein